MNSYPGSCEGKVNARNIAMKAIRLLAGESVFQGSMHAYLAGKEAGDMRIAYDMGVSPNLLCAADNDPAAILSCKQELPVPLHDRLYSSKTGFIGMMSDWRSTKGWGIIFPDICKARKVGMNLLWQAIRFARKDAILALNFTYARDREMKTREQYKQLLPDYSKSISDPRDWKPLTSACLVRQDLSVPIGGRNIHFPLAIAYGNRGEGRDKAVPMLTLIGRFSSTNEMSAPSYFIRMIGKGQSYRMVRSIHPQNDTSRLPFAFKDYMDELNVNSL
jgi:hypothetical protein